MKADAKTEVAVPLKGMPSRVWVPASIIYFVVHFSLDWLSRRYPDGAAGIIALNPAAGLGIVLVCRYGRTLAPLIVGTTLVSSLLLRNSAESISGALIEGLIVGGIYSGAALMLSNPVLNFKPRLSTLRDLWVFMGVASLSSALVATCYVGALVVLGDISMDSVPASLFRYWVGDLIGIAILAPACLLALQSRIEFRPIARSVLQLCITASLLLFAILTREGGRFPYFYFLFFPVIWISVVSGLEGVVLALALIQAAMYCAVIVLQLNFLDITDFQARMVALAATALIAGVLVTERRIADEEARIQHDALTQIATRGSMGEFGTAIAHEVNQPLSAAGTFAGLVVEGLESEQIRDTSIIDNARKVVRQIDRASGVVRGLRALVRLTNHEQAPVSVERILTEVSEHAAPDALRHNIEIKVNVPAGLPFIFVDRLQVEQALLNLTRNAMDSIIDAGALDRTITIYAAEIEDGPVEIGVIDTGPGFPAQFSLERLKPFDSTKPDGLGVGLSLCRSIGLANGARLHIHSLDRGAQVSLAFDRSRRVQHE